MCKWHKRVHDDDPEDTIFDEIDDEGLLNITAHLANLDDARIKHDGVAKLPEVAISAQSELAVIEEAKQGKSTGLLITDIGQTVAQLPLDEGVTREDAIDAMLSKAVKLNMKLVG